jgi:pyruvate/2-oxoglutarate/acetoin dehydrogenase E1 component
MGDADKPNVIRSSDNTSWRPECREIRAIPGEKAFRNLDGLLVPVTWLDTTVPVAPTLEEAFLPNAKKMFIAAKELARF